MHARRAADSRWAVPMLKIDSANDRVSLDTVDKEPDGQQLSEGRAGGNALRPRNLCERLLI